MYIVKSLGPPPPMMETPQFFSFTTSLLTSSADGLPQTLRVRLQGMKVPEPISKRCRTQKASSSERFSCSTAVFSATELQAKITRKNMRIMCQAIVAFCVDHVERKGRLSRSVKASSRNQEMCVLQEAEGNVKKVVWFENISIYSLRKV